jgi:hypothetical protein
MLLFCSVSGFQQIYIKPFRVVNRTSQWIWITPVGISTRGTGILRQFMWVFPALGTVFGKNLPVKPGGSRKVLFDRKGWEGAYQIVLCNANAEYRLASTEPSPVGDRLDKYREDQHVVDNWDLLPEVPPDVLKAATEPDRSWAEPAMLLIGLLIASPVFFRVFCRFIQYLAARIE